MSGAVDLHFDLTALLLHWKETGQDVDRLMDETVEGLRRGGFDAAVSSLFLHGGPQDWEARGGPTAMAIAQIEELHRQIDRRGDLALCGSLGELNRAWERGQIVLLLSFEGGEPLMGDEGLLALFYDLGVRGLGPVWSRDNELGCGAPFDFTKPNGGGLTWTGKGLVASALEQGYWIDVSHLTDRGFDDVASLCEAAGLPFLASHSNARSLTGAWRNLTDDQLRRLAGCGGLVGLNGYEGFLRATPDRPGTLEDLAAHGRYMENLMGPGHLALGLDCCDGFGGGRKADVLSHDQGPSLRRAFEKAGFDQGALAGVMKENWLAFLSRLGWS